MSSVASQQLRVKMLLLSKIIACNRSDGPALQNAYDIYEIVIGVRRRADIEEVRHPNDSADLSSWYNGGGW